MKRAIILLLSTILLSGCLPAIDTRQALEADLTFEKITAAEGFTKDDLYSAIKFWVVDNFKSANDVIQYDSKDDGTIICKGVIHYPCSGSMDCMAKGNWKVRFTMRIDIKDNKFKVNFSNLTNIIPSSINTVAGYMPGGDAPVWMQADLEKIKPVLTSMQDSILPSIKKHKANKDW